MEFGKITDEGIALLRQRIGVERKKSNMHREGPLELTRETIRRFALGSGDDNPLYLNREYAAQSRHGTLIAPPSIASFMEKANGASEGLPGCHTIWRLARLEWYKPLKLGDSLVSSSFLQRVEEVPSKFSGRAVVQDYDTPIKNQNGEHVASYFTSWHRFSRAESKSQGKYQKRGLWKYSKEEIEKIKADYKKEKRRGAETLWWEDVQVGEELPFVVKGPTTAISQFAFESWSGAGGWFVGHRLALELFERHPGLPFINEQGIPEAPVAIHWSNERCQSILGLPGAYEAGFERMSWLVHLMMNWVGDEGLIHRLEITFPKFNYRGDTIWCHGRVVEKMVLPTLVDDKQHAVRLDIWTVNQTGEITTKGEAVVVLKARG